MGNQSKCDEIDECLNIKVLKPLSSFNTYLTLPEQYIPSSVMFVPIMALDTGIRIGTSGEVILPVLSVEPDIVIIKVLLFNLTERR